MIISHKYKFIFIKTGKTAGTSIEIFLSQFCGKNDIVTPIYPTYEQHIPRNYRGYWNPMKEILYKPQSIHTTINDLKNKNKFYNHIPAKVAKYRIDSEVWNSYYKICVERNPWDKTLSHYHMMNHRSNFKLTFDDYLSHPENFFYNYKHYCDDKTILVDKVLKYENLVDEFSEFCKKMSIDFHGSFGVNAKSEYRQDRRPYQEVYTDAQRAIVQQAFEYEIKLHGYTF